MAHLQQHSEGVGESPFPFNSGALQLSDLDHSERLVAMSCLVDISLINNVFVCLTCSGSLASSAPRRLKPISPPLHKKRKKRTKIPQQSLPPLAPDSFPPSKASPLMNQDMLSQLMSRMKEPDAPPTVTTPVPSNSFSPQRTLGETPHPSQALEPTTVSPGYEGSQSESTVEPRHKKKRRRRPREDHKGVALEAQRGGPTELQEGVVLEPQQPHEGVVLELQKNGPQEGVVLKPQYNEPLKGVALEALEGVRENEDPIPVMRDTMRDTLSPMSTG